MLVSLLTLSALAIVALHAAPLTEDAFVIPGQSFRQESPQERFIRVDVNGDKSMTFDEFLHTDRVYEEAKKEEFDMFDRNSDGKITREEYDEHYKEQQTRSDQIREKYFADIFQEYDKDQSRTLSEEEVKQILRGRFLLEPRNNFGQIYYKFDTDHTGELDLQEYIKLDTNFPFDQTDPIRFGSDQKKIPVEAKPF